jgi:penicillin-binding protein 1A
VLGLLGFAAFTFGLLTAIAEKIPELDPARQHDTQANTYVYANDGHTILAVLRGSQARIVVGENQISPWMKHAIVAAEDKRFYEHHGVDLRGMARAVWADITHHGAVQGGSTITQQFVKNAYLTGQKTIGRKLIEAALAWQLEQKWSKDRILTAYLNTVYFGNQAYGVEQASRIYFHHSAAQMQPAEAALLAGIPEDPSLYDPVAHPAEAKARRALVLQLMLQQQYLTYGQYRASLRAPMPNPHDVSLPSSVSQQAPYFTNYVRDQLVEQFGPAKALSGGLHVKTTIDLGLQKIARDAAQSVLPDPNGPQVAMVAMDTQGRVLAMVGGRNYHQSQFNLATQGQRQPGSAFKPFVLATSLLQHISPSSVLTSKPVTIYAGGRLWPVSNYEGEYLGPITLATGIAASDNAVYSQLTAIVGPQNVKRTAQRLGITTPLHGYFSIGLGGEWTTPLDMARAYSSFADGGYRIDGSLFGNQPRAVECLADARGRCTIENKIVRRPVLTPAQDEVLNQLLQGVVTSGTGKLAALPGREVAGKTGTTTNYGDAWFVGYTPQLVTAVWVGYPTTERPMLTEYHGHQVAGGTYPALVWKAFMSKALPYLQDTPQNFPAPPYIPATPATVVNRGGTLELDNGVCKNTYQMLFFDGQVPPHTATCKPNEVEVPNVVGETLAAAQARLQGQPLTPAYVFKPARPGERLNVVLGQFPARGTLSAYDKVTLVLPKSLHGAIPRVIGWPLARAKTRLAKLKVDVHVTGGSDGRVVWQLPRGDSAAAPGLKVTLVVKKA